jgi:hypothetical protein
MARNSHSQFASSDMHCRQRIIEDGWGGDLSEGGLAKAVKRATQTGGV